MEFSNVPEHSAPEEYTYTPLTPVTPEYRELHGEYTVPDETGTVQSKKEKVREERFSHRLKNRTLMIVFSTIVAVSLIYTSYNVDLLGLDVFDTEYLDFHEWVHDFGLDDPSGNDKAFPGSVDRFPELDNLEPNGSVPGYGVLNEEYIMFYDDSGNKEYVYAGTKHTDNGAVIAEIDGVSYDYDTNTLTLTDYTGDNLEVNLMGNGFTLRLVGDNHLQSVMVYGFYYGGSLLITGTGSLGVNENDIGDFSIMLEAEKSQTCLMIDNTVTVNTLGPVLVFDTTMDNPILVLTPSVIEGGVVEKMEEYEEDGQTYYSYWIHCVEDDGTFVDYSTAKIYNPD